MGQADEAAKVRVVAYVGGHPVLEGTVGAIPSVPAAAPITRESLEGMVKSAALRSIAQGGMTEEGFRLCRDHLSKLHEKNESRRSDGQAPA